MESGSNDPMSYMLTVVFVAAMLGSDVSVPMLLIKQIAIGLMFGVAIAYASAAILQRVNFSIAQGGTIFVFAVAVLSYALPSFFEGNGYLSAYLAGILLGKMHFPGKRDLTRFFDAITHLAQGGISGTLGGRTLIAARVGCCANDDGDNGPCRIALIVLEGIDAVLCLIGTVYCDDFLTMRCADDLPIM